MARKTVVEIECNRCSRKETQDTPDHPVAVDDKNNQVDAPVFAATLNLGEASVTCSFADLCQPCVKTIRAHLAEISKIIKGHSPDRKKGEAGAKKKGHAPSA